MGLVVGLVFPDLSSRRGRSSAAYGAAAWMGGRCRVWGGLGWWPGLGEFTRWPPLWPDGRPGEGEGPVGASLVLGDVVGAWGMGLGRCTWDVDGCHWRVNTLNIHIVQCYPIQVC